MQELNTDQLEFVSGGQSSPGTRIVRAVVKVVVKAIKEELTKNSRPQA